MTRLEQDTIRDRERQIKALEKIASMLEIITLLQIENIDKWKEK